MSLERKRILHLFYILTQQSGYIRSFELAQKVGVTERTIKSDIHDLEIFAMDSGAKLHSKKGSGYMLEITDADRYYPVKNQLIYYYSYYNASGDDVKDEDDNVKDILRRVITEEAYMTVDNIAEELYLTKGSIREDMRIAKEILNDFNMSFKKPNEEGPLIQGNEMNRRMLMLAIYDNHYHEAMVLETFSLFKDGDYLKWFEWDEKERYDIRHIFLKGLRDSECHIRDDHTQRLSRYLCLMANRFKEGYKIELNDRQRAYIMSLRQAEVAKTIIKNLQIDHGFDVSEDEILAFGLMLAFWADIAKDCVLEKNYALKFDESKQFTELLMQSIKKDFNLDLHEIDGSERAVQAALIPLLIQKDFKVCKQDIRYFRTQDERIQICPLATRMAYNAAELFYIQYGEELSLYNILSISMVIHSRLLKISYPIRPIRACVSVSAGLEASYALADLIHDRIGRYFECLDSYELYEMRKLKTEDYDWCIGSYPFFTYKYDWPFISVNAVPTQSQMNEIYNKAVLGAVDLKQVFDHLHLKELNVWRDFDYSDEESFIRLISFRNGKDCGSIDRIEEDIRHTGKGSVYGKVGVLFLKRALVKEAVFEIFQLKKTGKFQDNDVEILVVISVDFDDSPQAARFINDLMYMFYSDTENIWMVIDTNKIEGLIDVVRESLKALPISLV